MTGGMHDMSAFSPFVILPKVRLKAGFLSVCKTDAMDLAFWSYLHDFAVDFFESLTVFLLAIRPNVPLILE